MTSRRYRHAPCQREFLTSYSSATRHEWLNLFSSRHECFTSDSGLTRIRLVSCVFLTSLLLRKLHHSKLVFRRTQNFGARLGRSELQATLLSYTFLSNLAVNILSDVIFQEKRACSKAKASKMGHVLNDFRPNALRQRVLRRDASSLYFKVTELQ